MKKLLFILSVWFMGTDDSNAQPILLNAMPNTFSSMSAGNTRTKSNITEIEVDILEKGSYGTSIHSILQKSNTLGLPFIFFQELRKADEIGGKQSLSLINHLISDSEQYFREFVMGIAFFHFLIDEEVVKKRTVGFHPADLKFNSGFEVNTLHSYQLKRN
jgi:hypothetical protein